MIIGVQYERMPNPRPEDWARDLPQIAALGARVVRTWLYWRKVNPAPDTWVWNHYDRLFELAQQSGLQVQIQLFCEAPPEYLIRQQPDWAYLDAAGHADRYYRRPAQQVGGFQGFDYAHPGARAAAVDYITRVAAHYRDHPALFGYDVWNEIWMSQWLDSPSSRAQRVEFLRRRYGSLAGLNAAWLQEYTDWDQVEDPRQSHPLGLKHILEGLHVDNMDMLAFENEMRAWHMRWRCDAVRAADPHHPVMAHAGGSTALHFDGWHLAPPVDIWGVSEHMPDLNAYALSCHACAATAAGKPWWLAENSSGRFYLGLAAQQRSAAFVRSTHVLALMHAASADIFWQYRPEICGPESPNFGLVGLDGEPTARSSAVAALCGMHRAHADVLDHLQFEAPTTGLVYSPRGMAFQQVEGGERHWQNFKGWYFALCHQGSPPMLLKDEAMAQTGVPAGLKVLVAPMQMIEQPGLSAGLAAWVRAGGTLIGGPWFELYDPNLVAHRRSPGTTLFGVRQTDVARDDDATLTCLGDLRNIHSLPAGGLVEQLALEGAHPLAVAGHRIVVTARALGQGRAVYVGCQPGIAYDHEQAPQLGRLVEVLCRQAGAPPPLRATGGCIYRLAHSPRGDVLCIVNPHASDTVAWLEGPSIGARALDLLDDEPLDLTPGDGYAALALPAHGARILSFYSPHA